MRLETLVTTEHTDHGHNESYDVQSVDETVADQQHTPETETSVADTEPSSEMATSDTRVSHDNTFSATAIHSEDAPSTEHTEDEAATTAFAEESGMTIPELSTFVTAENVQAPTTQEETHTVQEESTASTQAETPAAETLVEVNTPVAQEATRTEQTEPAEEQVATPSAQAEPITSETIDAVASPVFEGESISVVSEVAPAAEASQEAVRPFTSFIEEFHQAQAQAEAQAEAHLSASLQEPQADGFAEFATPEMDSTAVDQPISLEEALPPVDFGEGSAFVPSSDDVTTVDVAEVNTPSLAEAVITEENQRVTAVVDTSSIESATQDTQPPERPVSPLLRPALRPRPARHAVTRHRDEPAASLAAPASTTETPVSAETPTTTQSTQEASVTTPTPEQVTETPKPARRYRFDRPAAKTAPTLQTPPPAVSKPAPAAPATPATATNGGSLTPPPATQPTPTFARVEESTTPTFKTPTVSTSSASTVETTTSEQQSGESASMESTSTISSPVEQGRRRHNPARPERHQQEKEQIVTPPVVAAVSVAEIATALVGENSKAEEVAPEDMPPLEYAELQKANSSRRRRRHRTPTPGTPVAKETIPATNGTQPISQPTSQPVVAPLAPAQPIQPAAQSVAPVKPPTPTASPYSSPPAAPPVNPYTITSGYTVGQMNQGNEESGPFMGPEPSPARGSVVTTREGRTARAESQPQRTSAPYQTRAVEGMLPAASMNHFANIVSQAIQTQTDRMVSELRRANQAPTNVSVSLPPFPSTERVGVFVDVANLLYSARTQRIAIDFGKLLDFLRGNRRLIRAHAYCPTSPQPGDEQMFLTAVKGLGYRITTKNYKTFASGAKKADLDLDLCMDVVRIVDGGAVDCIVLVSGDSDFMPMLDYCSDHGVRVEVAAFDEAMSATLRQSCDLFVNLSMLEEIRA